MKSLSRVARSALGKSVRAYVTAQNRSGARHKGPQSEAGRAEVEAER